MFESIATWSADFTFTARGVVIVIGARGGARRETERARGGEEGRRGRDERTIDRGAREETRSGGDDAPLVPRASRRARAAMRERHR
eukprot:29684-Pelagococcus_subviridis.AAC.3